MSVQVRFNCHFYETMPARCLVRPQQAFWTERDKVLWRREGVLFTLTLDADGEYAQWDGHAGKYVIYSPYDALMLPPLGEAHFACDLSWRSVTTMRKLVTEVPERWLPPKKQKRPGPRGLSALDAAEARHRVLTRGELVQSVASDLGISADRLRDHLRRLGTHDARFRPHSDDYRVLMRKGQQERFARAGLTPRLREQLSTVREGLGAGLKMREIAELIGTSQPYVSHLKKKLHLLGDGGSAH